MRAMVRVLTIAILLLNPLMNSAAESFSKPEFESAEYATLKLKQSQPDMGCGGLQREPIRKQILKNFDPKCLSSADCRVALKVTILADGTYEIKKVYGKSDSDADDFFCEQAVWEYAIPMRGYAGEDLLCEFSGTDFQETGTHPEIVQNQTSDCVSLHLIPERFPFVGLTFPVCALNDNFNVVRLSKDKLRDPRLNEYRREWVKFFTPTGHDQYPMYDRLRAKALELENKYNLLTPCSENTSTKDQKKAGDVLPPPAKG